MVGHSILFSLPWEILLLIFDELDPAFQVAFALAAKPFWTGFFPSGKVSLNDEDNLVDLLMLLERDIPTRYFCFQCARLRPYSPSGEPSCDHPPPSRLSQKFQYVRKYYPSWMPESEWPDLSFLDARLVMNRHFYGPSYGLPLKRLEYRTDVKKYLDLGHRRYFTRYQNQKLHREKKPWRVIHISNAKIVNDELLLARSLTIAGPSVPLKQFRRVLEKLQLPLCRHLACSQTMPFPYRYDGSIGYRQLPQISFLHPTENNSTEYAGSCAQCFTDYVISIRGQAGVTEWVLELSVYHRFGSFRTPGDLIWLSNVTDSSPSRLGLFNLTGHREFGPGEIRRRWHLGSAAFVEKESVWAAKDTSMA
ncbi:hypothetical protein FALBO_5942 [Fusarium albosuccineum]|uniref:F-box domain-containing protein n=1 Tax=Fusarium albosuccineum TaxID=1237068 RepID=A0A8H4P9B4_9HYPO|nr:hypothetical protein FALBO_5942 [Fusarium albosuccineum]